MIRHGEKSNGVNTNAVGLWNASWCAWCTVVQQCLMYMDGRLIAGSTCVHHRDSQSGHRWILLVHADDHHKFFTSLSCDACVTKRIFHTILDIFDDQP